MGNDRREPGDPVGGSVFGAALRLHRHSRGLSQEDLSGATRGRVAVRTISDLERGVARRPRAETLRLLAEALGLAGAPLAEFQAAARGPRPPAAAALAVTQAEAVAREQAVGRPATADGAQAAGHAQAAGQAGFAGLLAPVIIVTGAARLAGMELLLSGAAGCLVLIAGGQVLPAADARFTALETATTPAAGPLPRTAARPQPAARTVRRASRVRSRRRP
jgi:transcriptional regulator with XRE-family HTH domain